MPDNLIRLDKRAVAAAGNITEENSITKVQFRD